MSFGDKSVEELIALAKELKLDNFEIYKKPKKFNSKNLGQSALVLWYDKYSRETISAEAKRRPELYRLNADELMRSDKIRTTNDKTGVFDA